MKESIIAWILVFLASVNSAFGNYFLKMSQRTIESYFESLFSLYFWAGIVMYAINVLFFAYSLKILEVSKAYPVLAALGFSLLAIIGHFFLDEPFSWVNTLGLAIIILGIVLLTR